MDQKSETEIVARVLNGDRQAYALLIDAYKSPICPAFPAGHQLEK